MKSTFALVLLTVWVAGGSPARALSAEADSDLHWVAQELEVADVLDALSRQAEHGPTLFRDVTTVDVVTLKRHAHQSVMVREGKIAWVGDAARAPTIAGVFIIEGHGLNLAPGLTDMHVHTTSLAEQLLRLAAGVTGVREMDGFPWMLRLRRAVDRGRLLAPNMYIAGTIIAEQPLDGYAVVVHSADEARAVVRDQKACGYDFIKVHNLLRLPQFDAVAAEAHLQGLDLIGHIPHDISIDHALHSGHMRTVEHLKGFLLDRTLLVSPEDYAKATAGVSYWQTPTFYVDTGYLHGAAAFKELARPEMRYLPLRKKEQWRAIAAADSERDDKVLRLLTTAQHAAVARLLPLHPHWLAGTDSAQYNFNIAGYALLEELDRMRSFAIAQGDVLRSATSEPAAAMRRSDFGQIKAGMRADLVLLAADPAHEIAAYRANRGVMVRGIWLSRAALERALDRLAQVESEPDGKFQFDAPQASELATRIVRLSDDNIALDPKGIERAVTRLRSLGLIQAADTLARADTDGLPGPCLETLEPGGD